MPETHYLAFVDSIAASPTVRLNLHYGTRGPWNMREGSRFDPPPLKRSVPSTMLADGGTPTAAAYDNRAIVLRLQLLSNGVPMAPDAAAAQMQLLIRELDRPGNFLRYQSGIAAPVFFRTYRSGPDAVDFHPTNRELTVTLLAEPFAYGLKESQSPVAVSNNPASGMVLDVTSPKGDVETPLYLALTGTMGVTGRLQSGLAIRRRGTPSAGPFLLQAESMTQGTDTTTQANSASFSGSGNNWARTTFATVASAAVRLSTTAFPSSASTDARGTYRVFLRNRHTVGGDSIDVQLQWGISATPTFNDVIRLPANVNIQYTDLGIVQIPVGYDPVYDGLSGVEIPAAGAYFGVSVRRNSGSGNFDADCLLFMPADDRMQFIKWPTSAGGTDIFVAEGGPRPAVYSTTSGGNLISTQPIEIVGGGLMITPGRTNRLYFARDLGSTVAAAGGADDLTASTTITPSYYPRYLAPLKPVST